ncbi:MAG: tandem-95 repeat protein, partial [Planctomycetaceae bacterium]
GLSGYAGTSDTMIVSGTADTPYSSESSLNVDTASSLGGVSQVLLRFDSIIGEATDQIPPGAGVSSATLRLNSLDTGNGGHFHAMLQSWSDTSTWNSLTNGVTADGVEAMSIADASVGTNGIGYVDLNVTGTVQSWVSGAMVNNGWAVLPNGTDGWHIASAEYGTAAYRPELIVTFVPTGDVPPVANAGVDQTVVDNDRDGTELVTLNGSASSPAASIVSYLWTIGTVEIANTAVAQDVPFLAPGVYHVTLTVRDGTGLSDTDEVVITVEVPSLFSEGFESGGFTAGGWVTSGQATVETTSAHSGTYGALLKKAASVATTINTGGATGATFTYWARTAGLKAGSEYLYVEWSQDGSTWHQLDTLTGDTGWAQFSHDISPAPSSFRIRFRTNGSSGSDMAMIDDIVITGAAAGGNTAPSASDDSATMNEDAPVVISVLANDIDIDGDTLSITSVTQGSKGVAAINGTTVTYTPNANANGEDSFTYTVGDGRGGTDTATVTVTINPVDDLPVARDDTATTAMDTPVTINVLANDSDVDSALDVVSVSPAAHGTPILNANDTITYTPAASYSGSDSFSYTLAGGVTATVTVTVQGAVPTMHVGGLDGTATVRGNSSQWAVTVTVTVVDQAGAPVSGATVTGAWSG